MKRSPWVLLLGAALLVFVVDEAAKLYFSGTFVPGQSVPLVPNIFHLTYVQNTGAAFGLLKGARWFLVGISSVILLLVFGYVWTRRGNDLLMFTALGCIVGGSISNLLDRIFRGYVVDFLDFRVWPVFNVADMMINIGVALLIVRAYFGHKEAA